MIFAHRAIAEHEVLQRILQTEPEILLPALTVEANETHRLVAAFLKPYLVRHGMVDGAQLEQAADFLARMVLSYIESPGRWDLTTRLKSHVWSGPSCWRASDEHPAEHPTLLPPSDQTVVRRLRPLRQADLHRLHDPRPGGLAVPRVCAHRSQEEPDHPALPEPELHRRGRLHQPDALRHRLIAVNVICFVASGFGKNSVLDRFGEWPYAIHAGHQYYRVFDAMFLHLSFEHIFFNMFTLLIIGPAVEIQMGRSRFLALYLIGRLGGGAFQYLFGPSNELGVGASGAIFALMGAYVVVAHRRRLPGQVSTLIVINLVIGFADSSTVGRPHRRIGRRRPCGPHVRVADQLRPRTTARVVTGLTSAAALGILAVLVFTIAPGHFNIG